MKAKLILLISILSFTIAGCTSNSKTPHELYWEQQIGKTDEELLEAIYNKPMLYKIIGQNIEPKTDEDYYDGRLEDGAVLHVVFKKNEVYIERFGILNGDYLQHHYANSDGSIVISNGNSPARLGKDASRLGQLRGQNESIGITQVVNVNDGFSSHKAKVWYNLQRM